MTRSRSRRAAPARQRADELPHPVQALPLRGGERHLLGAVEDGQHTRHVRGVGEDVQQDAGEGGRRRGVGGDGDPLAGHPFGLPRVARGRERLRPGDGDGVSLLGRARPHLGQQVGRLRGGLAQVVAHDVERPRGVERARFVVQHLGTRPALGAQHPGAGVVQHTA